MTALKPSVHHTVTPMRATQASGGEVSQGIESGSPIAPRYWFTKPMLVSSRKRHSEATTATPSTYGAKYSARKRLRALNFEFISSATASGTASSSGTLKRVKIPVARIPCQKGPAVVESDENSFA